MNAGINRREGPLCTGDFGQPIATGHEGGSNQPTSGLARLLCDFGDRAPLSWEGMRVLTDKWTRAISTSRQICTHRISLSEGAALYSRID